MNSFETLEDALRVAQQVVVGELDPNLGCSLIAEISEKIGYLAELNPFVLLAHDQYGHEKLGFTAEALVPQIQEACRDLLLGCRL